MLPFRPLTRYRYTLVSDGKGGFVRTQTGPVFYVSSKTVVDGHDRVFLDEVAPASDFDSRFWYKPLVDLGGNRWAWPGASVQADWAASDIPDGTKPQKRTLPGGNYFDHMRSKSKLTKTFEAGTWEFDFYLLQSIGFPATRKMKLDFRLWKGADADGADATEITSGNEKTSLATFTASGDSYKSVSASVALSSVTFQNEYLFLQLGYELIYNGVTLAWYTYFSVLQASPNSNRIVTPDVEIYTTLPVFGIFRQHINEQELVVNSHEDIKPEDIIVTEDAAQYRVLGHSRLPKAARWAHYPVERMERPIVPV